MKPTDGMWSILCLVSLALGACSPAIDRAFLRAPPPPPAMQWDVQPQYFCPGDQVTVSWDFTAMPRSPENCRPRNGGFDRLTRCTSSASCPGDTADAVCLDNYCCTRTVFDRNPLMCEQPLGCYPTFGVRIDSDTVALSPPVEGVNNALTGTRTVAPHNTVTFRARGSFTPPLTLFAQDKTATLVTPTPATHIRLPFHFACMGDTPGWRRHFLDDVTSAAHVRIAGVRNVSSRTIRLGRVEPAVGPITIRPGEIVHDFDGGIGSIWSAALDPLDPASLRVPRCTSTFIEDRWPDLPVDLILACAPD